MSGMPVWNIVNELKALAFWSVVLVLAVGAGVWAALS